MCEERLCPSVHENFENTKMLRRRYLSQQEKMKKKQVLRLYAVSLTRLKFSQLKIISG